MNIKNTLTAALLLAATTLMAQPPVEIKLWTDGVPESNGITLPERRNERGHFENVTDPSIYVYRPEASKNNGTAVVICPGGGYGIQAFVHEGEQIAQWLAQNGATGVVLKYRLPNGNHFIPLKDTHRAIELVRANAQAWGVDPQKVGIMGSSAGGHLASTAATHFTAATRPDFAILFYPVITMKEGGHYGSKVNLLGKQPSAELIELYSNEMHIDANTPPTLLLLSDDDKGVLPENSILFYQALKRADVAASMHIFPEGGHGWGWNSTFKYHEDVKRLIAEWLKTILKD